MTDEMLVVNSGARLLKIKFKSLITFRNPSSDSEMPSTQFLLMQKIIKKAIFQRNWRVSAEDEAPRRLRAAMQLLHISGLSASGKEKVECLQGTHPPV